MTRALLIPWAQSETLKPAGTLSLSTGISPGALGAGGCATGASVADVPAVRACRIPGNAPAVLSDGRPRARTRGRGRPGCARRRERPRGRDRRQNLVGCADPRRRRGGRGHPLAVCAGARGAQGGRELGRSPTEVRAARQMIRRAAPLLLVCLAVAPAAAQQYDDPTRLEPVVLSVTRMEQKAGDAPASLTAVTRCDIRASASQTLDVDLMLSRTLSKNAEVFVGVENLFDEVYTTARTS